jgi:hypothetical protein
VELFQLPFTHIAEFWLSALIVAAMIVVMLKAAMTAERRGGLARWITNPNAKWLFGGLFLVWALVFGIGLQLVPHEGASSPYGGLGLIALFSGFFIMMGFLWAVIGD